MITIAILRAAGASEAFIAKVAELEERERIAERREQWRQQKKNQRNQRARPQCPAEPADTPLTVLLPSSLNLPSIDRPLPTAARAKHAKTPLPPDWQPKGEQRDVAEADEFRDHARAKGYRYIDWDAAYRNFQKSP